MVRGTPGNQLFPAITLDIVRPREAVSSTPEWRQSQASRAWPSERLSCFQKAQRGAPDSGWPGLGRQGLRLSTPQGVSDSSAVNPNCTDILLWPADRKPWPLTHTLSSLAQHADCGNKSLSPSHVTRIFTLENLVQERPCAQ